MYKFDENVYIAVGLGPNAIWSVNGVRFVLIRIKRNNLVHLTLYRIATFIDEL